ncbi:MAG: hypothetical protein RLZZ574_854, partial [Cyanobacteriota bacterium]
KKRHTFKSQAIIDTQSLKVICTAHGIGKEHDFELFKTSKVKPLTRVEVLADKGYQGIKKIHNSSYTPIKKTKSDAARSWGFPP